MRSRANDLSGDRLADGGGCHDPISFFCSIYSPGRSKRDRSEPPSSLRSSLFRKTIYKMGEGLLLSTLDRLHHNRLFRWTRECGTGVPGRCVDFFSGRLLFSVAASIKRPACFSTYCSVARQGGGGVIILISSFLLPPSELILTHSMHYYKYSTGVQASTRG